MGDAVLRVRSHLQGLARDNWSALEEKHARNVSWLRDELAQISRSLELKAKLDVKKSPVQAPFPRNEALDVERVYKKQRVDTSKEKETREDHGRRRSSYRGRVRLSMRLRAKPQYVPSAGDAKKSRKRPRPAEVLLTDPGKLKVAELRTELKKRGLRTSGLKAVLCDRLLDALEEEHDELSDIRQESEKDIDMEDDVGEQEADAAMDTGPSDDDVVADEIVRESLGSYNPSSSQRSNLESPSGAQQELSAAGNGSGEQSDVVDLVEEKEHAFDLTYDEEEHVDSENASREVQKTSSNGVHLNSAGEAEQEQAAAEEHRTELPAKRDGEPKATASANRLWARRTTSGVLQRSSKTHRGTNGDDEISETAAPEKLTRKSMQVGESTEVSSPLTLKRRSILRKTSSLAPTTRGIERKVSFAPTDLVNTIIESSQTDSTQPDPSPEKAPSVDAHTPQDANKRVGPEPNLDTEDTSTTTPITSTSSVVSPTAAPPAPSIPLNETEEERKTREFQETVAREAQRLRLAAKLSAQKRFQEAKATNAFWAKHDELKKLALRASSSNKKSKSVTPSSSSGDEHLGTTLQTPESSTSAESSSSSSETHRLTRKPHQASVASGKSTSAPIENAPEHNATTAPVSAVASGVRGPDGDAIVDAEEDGSSLMEAAHKPKAGQPADGEATGKKDEHSGMHPAAPMVSRDSIISTVSSISEQSIVEAALNAGASSATNGGRRPISNLVSGIQSFTTLMEKAPSEAKAVRSAPVVNALRLAEKSRLAEEKKRQEKEQRKAALKKKLDEAKRAAEMKEKAEKDAKARREQEQKKREAELARRRQQRLKEMREGIEKKRAMLAAGKKALTARGQATSSASAQHKHGGLTNAANSSNAAAKLAPKPMSKTQPTSRPQAVSNPAPKPAVTPAAPPNQLPKSHSPEIVNYEMSDNAESSDEDSSSDSESGRHGKKKVPKWAQKDHLNKILHAQFGRNAVDPSPSIFTDFVDTCDLEAIFETTDVRKKKRFARRTSSGNWLADRPTARDRALYQRDMGYKR